MISAPIRLFVFDDRIEIISPGHLPNNLTVERIRAGISNIRNPILISYVAKGLLPYRGLGSGITRALKDWPDITFLDDREGGLFTATVRRALPRTAATAGGHEKTTQKTTQKILHIVAEQPTLTRQEIAELLGDITQDGVKYHLEKLKAAGKLRRIGPDKGGRWEVLNP